jgi:hypothetical protein
MEPKVFFRNASYVIITLVTLLLGSLGVEHWKKTHKAITVDIKGPQAILLGDTATFYLSITGEHGLPRWDFIAPPEESGNGSILKPVDSLASMAVEFSPVVAGDHILIASVGGPGDQSIPAKKRITVVDPNQQPEEPIEPGPPQPEPGLLENLQRLLQNQQMQPSQTVPDRMKAVLGQINSETYDQDKKIVFSCIQAMIGRISTGLVATDADVIHDLEIDASNALGEKYDLWKIFFSELRNVVDTLRRQGNITTAATYLPLLTEVRNVLR